MTITKDIRYVGVNDRKIDLFEGQYVVPEGMAYNSYVILDDKIAVMDTVDRNFTHEWLDNLATALDGRTPDYLIVQHMEPDHSANIVNFLKTYPKATVVASQKAFAMMKNFFGQEFEDRRLIVSEGDTLSLGRHTLSFITAPMVHWPEVLMTYDSADRVLFSADAFGKFGALDAEEDWACEARRYYFGIVGKYGAQVQAVLKKAAALDIAVICPLHGPVLTENLGYYLNLYNIWSSYGVESDGIMIAYTSVYGNTKKAVSLLADKLKERGCPKVVPPYRQAEFTMLHGEGISKEACLLSMGADNNVIEKSGSWFIYNGEKLGQGAENARQYLKDNPEVANEIENKLKEMFLNTGTLPAKAEKKSKKAAS